MKEKIIDFIKEEMTVAGKDNTIERTKITRDGLQKIADKLKKREKTDENMDEIEIITTARDIIDMVINEMGITDI